MRSARGEAFSWLATTRVWKKAQERARTRRRPAWRFGDPDQPATSWSLTSLVGQDGVDGLRSAGEDPFLILGRHGGQSLARCGEDLRKRPGRGGVIGPPGDARGPELADQLLEEG